jgi:hypothetical protein
MTSSVDFWEASSPVPARAAAAPATTPAGVAGARRGS